MALGGCLDLDAGPLGPISSSDPREVVADRRGRREALGAEARAYAADLRDIAGVLAAGLPDYVAAAQGQRGLAGTAALRAAAVPLLALARRRPGPDGALRARADAGAEPCGAASLWAELLVLAAEVAEELLNLSGETEMAFAPDGAHPTQVAWVQGSGRRGLSAADARAALAHHRGRVAARVAHIHPTLRGQGLAKAAAGVQAGLDELAKALVEAVRRASARRPFASLDAAFARAPAFVEVMSAPHEAADEVPPEPPRPPSERAAARARLRALLGERGRAAADDRALLRLARRTFLTLHPDKVAGHQEDFAALSAAYRDLRAAVEEG